MLKNNFSIYLDFDEKCLSKEKIESGILGGTERFFLLLKAFLEGQELSVDTSDTLSPKEIYDVAIYSNVKHRGVNANKQICWAGSFHTDASFYDYDLIIANSQFFLEFIGKPGIVIPACYDNDILDYKIDFYHKRQIITTSNPTRHYDDTLQVSHLLDNKIIDYTWLLTGGNKLYCPSFPESFNNTENAHLNYLGIIDRNRLLTNLAASHLYCYPNFCDRSETQCVSAIEAAALGLPVILPNKKPFTEVLPDNPYFVSNHEECVNTIESLLNKERSECYICDVSRYSEGVIFDKILRVLVEEDNCLESVMTLLARDFRDKNFF